MEKNILLRRGIFLIVLLYLILPILHLLMFLKWDSFQFDPFFWQAIRGAFVQAAASTFFTLVFGSLGSLGLLSVKARWQPWIVRGLIAALVVPSFTPPIIVIALSVGVLGTLYTGLWGVVLFHTLMNVGLVSVLFAQVIESKAKPWFQMSLSAGVSRTRFIFKGLLPGLRSEITTFTFYLMILYFFSFSIPLIVGGTRYGGIEVFIFEKVTLFGQWSEALNYSLILFGLLFVLSFLVRQWPNPEKKLSSDVSDAFRFLNLGKVLSCSLWPSLFLFCAFTLFISKTSYWGFDYSLWEPLRGTLIVGMLTGLLLFILLSILSFCFMSGLFSNLLLALISPGWVVVGFSFLLIAGDGVIASLVKNALALSIIFLPFLYRMAFAQRLSDLRRQVDRATVFPVGWLKTFLIIIWPQCLPAIGFLSGIGALWACGDFALSSILLNTSEVSTLALDMKDLILSYRLEKAVSLLLPLLIASSIVFFLFQGMGYVCRRKILS